MRAFLKIVLILAAVALVAGGSFYFAETRLGPPRSIEKGNAHLDHLEKCLEGITPSQDIDSLNRLFFKIHHQLGFLADDSLLSSEDDDRVKTELVRRYGKVFADWCMQCFQGSVWEKKQLQMMKGRVEMLKGVKTSDKTAVLDGDADLLTRLDSVLTVVKRHADATKLMNRKAAFVSLDHSSNLIEASKVFRQHNLLKNDRELMEGLSALPEKLGKAHYDSLDAHVDHMRQYRWMRSMENVEKLYDRYSEELDDYERNAYRVYGHSYGVGELRSQLKEHMRAARSYWLNQEQPHYNISNNGNGFHLEVVREGY